MNVLQVHSRLADTAVPDNLHSRLQAGEEKAPAAVSDADVAALTDALFGKSSPSETTQAGKGENNLDGRNVSIADRIPAAAAATPLKK
jgi:hypothetical protein